MKSFDNIEDFLDFCKNNKKFCQKNRQKMADIASTIYLKNAGYVNFTGVDVTSIYKELNDISSKNGIGSGNPDFLSVRNEDIMNYVVRDGSASLKKFLRDNGHFIVDVTKPKKLKDLINIKQDIDTILLNPQLIPRSSTRVQLITPNKSTTSRFKPIGLGF